MGAKMLNFQCTFASHRVCVLWAMAILWCLTSLLAPVSAEATIDAWGSEKSAGASLVESNTDGGMEMGPLIRIEESKVDATPITRVDFTCSSSNGTEVDNLFLDPSTSVSLNPSSIDSQEVWTCSFKLNRASQTLVVYAAASESSLLPFPCDQQQCLWTIDYAGFNLFQASSGTYVQVRTWTSP